MSEKIQNFIKAKQLENISIEKAKECDFKAIKKIANQRREFLPALMIYNLKDGFKTNSLYIAKLNEDVVGFIRWHPRKDGSQTIHEIAVDRNFNGLGIGKKLFNLVPTPIQLKVTEDNHSAIEFYKKQNLQFDSIYEGKKRNLLVFRSPETPALKNTKKTRQKI